MIGKKDESLIFMISQPRAGSTLLQLMLAGHPDIATTSEPWLALHPLYALRERGIEAEYNSRIARLALLDFLKQAGSNEEFYKRQIASFLLSFYQQALDHQKKKYFLDKTPRYYLIIDELMELFPVAKFIFLIRHPMAVLNSIIRTWIKSDLKRLGLFKGDLLSAPKLISGASKRYADRSLVVKYENFVSNPETVLKNVCNYISIDYSDDMLDYGKRRPDWKFGDPVGINKSSCPTMDSLTTWKKGFKSPQLCLIANSYLKELGQGLMEELGYDYSEAVSATTLDSVHKTEDLMTWCEIMEYDQLKAERDGLREQNEFMLNSLSWKVTVPLRRFFSFIKRCWF